MTNLFTFDDALELILEELRECGIVVGLFLLGRICFLLSKCLCTPKPYTPRDFLFGKSIGLPAFRSYPSSLLSIAVRSLPRS